MKGYKGTDENSKCLGFPYEAGKEYMHEGELKLCPNERDVAQGKGGFHFCEYPLDVFSYYPPTSKLYEIEAEEVSSETSDDSKRVAKKIKIGAEIGIKGFVEGAVKFVFEKIDWDNAKETNTGTRSAATNTGYQSAATNTGNYSAATNTGTRSAATNTGNYSAATNTGNYSAAMVEGAESVAIALGIKGKAKSSPGGWITCAEWEQDENYTWHRIDVQTAKVDGETIKANTFYVLKNGKFAEVREG